MTPTVAFLDLTSSHAPLRADLDQVWSATVDGNDYTLGPAVEAFEAAWADYCGTDHAVGVANGTDALELILRGLGIGPGDEVVVPASTFVATAAAVVAAGATPVFTDVDPDTMLLTGDHLRAALSERTAAVIAVHLYGNTVDMADLDAVAAPAGIAVIEDAAQAHGADHDSRPAGSLGHAAGFSHYPTKNLGAFGDGGSVTTDDRSLVERIRRLRNHGRAAQSDQEYTDVGRTSRLDSLQAAVLSVKLPQLDSWVTTRRSIVTRYDELLPDGVHRVGRAMTSTASPHLCVVRVPHRDKIRRLLAEVDIGTGVHYPDPVPRTPAFGGLSGAYPEAERSADSVLSLPLWPGLTDEQIELVCSTLDRSMARLGP